MLTVSIPLAERAKPRRIDVAHGGGLGAPPAREGRSVEPTTVDSESLAGETRGEAQVPPPRVNRLSD